MKKYIHDFIILIIAIGWFGSLAPLISCVRKIPFASSKDSSYVETVRDTTVIGPGAKAETSLNIDSISSLISGNWYTYFDSLNRVSIAYMKDRFGRLNLKAETKPSVFNFPIKTKTIHTKQIIVQPPRIEKEVPFWAWLLIGVLLAWLVFILITNAMKGIVR